MNRKPNQICRQLVTVIIVWALLLWGIQPLQAATLQIDTIDPILVIDKVSMEQAVAGSDFQIGISVRNMTNNEGFDLAFAFEIKDTDSLAPFSLVANQNTVIDKIGANETRTMFFKFKVDEAAQNKDYEMIVKLTGKNAQFKETVNTVSTITVPVTYDLTKPVLIIRSADINPVQPDQSQEFDVNFRIENLSKTTDARNITFILDGGSNFEVREISNKKTVLKLAKGEDTVVSYRLLSKDSRSDNTVKLKISFDYLGSESSSVEETVNLPLSWANTGIGATPWVIVNKYTLSDERVLAGNTVTLNLYIENTNERPVKNVKISLGVIKIEETSGTTTTQTSGGTVFSPVNSSNSFYVDSIPGKSIVEKAVDLYVDPNAAAKTYIVPVEIKYEDRSGKTLECEELVNIPVTQECKLNILSMQVPPEGFIGQPVQVMAEFVNVGKVALGNFMVRLEGDFAKENSTYYVGNLEIGFNDFFQAVLIPEKEGPIEGKVIFSYIDNNNKDIEVEKTFTMNIMSQPAFPGNEGGMAGKPGNALDPRGGFNGNETSGLLPFVKAKWPTILFALFVIIEAVYIWRLKRNKRSGEFLDE